MFIKFLTIPKPGVVVRSASIVRTIVALVVLLSCIVPIVLLHVWLWVYELVYFTTFGIPRTKISEYMAIDRGRLAKLNLLQKIGCVYCGYANSVAAWSKDIANRTEIYSCAIKHQLERKGHEHQAEFHSYKEFS